MDAKAIGNRLKALRGNRTQEDVAKAIYVTRQAICQYESGARVPSDDIKVRIAEYYGSSVEGIFFADE